MVGSTTVSPRTSPTSSFVLSFGTRAKKIGIYMDGHVTESMRVKKTNVEVDDMSNDSVVGSSQRAFLSALLRNNLDQIRILLKGGVDPNFAIHIGLMGGGPVLGGNHTTTRMDDDGMNEKHHQVLSMKALCLDHVFLFKRILGEAPSPLHLAILNIYFRTKHYSSRYLLRQNRDEFDKAVAIFKLLLENGANLHQTSFQAMVNVDEQRPHANTPLTLAERIYRISCLVDTTKPATVTKTGVVADLQTTMRNVVNQCIEFDTRHLNQQREQEGDQTRGDIDVQDEDDIRQDDKSSSMVSTVQCRDVDVDDDDVDDDGGSDGEETMMVVQLEELADLIFLKGQSSSSPTMATFTYHIRSQYNALTFFCSDAST